MRPVSDRASLNELYKGPHFAGRRGEGEEKERRKERKEEEEGGGEEEEEEERKGGAFSLPPSLHFARFT